MGSLLSSLTGSSSNPNLDVPDPATGLTPREKNSVKRNWDVVKADIKQSGIDLLMLFFESYPSYQNFFKAFKDVPLKELPKNSKFHAHCTSVMYALTSIVDNLDDPECLVEMLSKLGENHQRRSIARQQFIDLKAVVIKFLKTKLGSKFTSEDETAWNKTLEAAYSVIFKGIDKAQEESTTKA